METVYRLRDDEEKIAGVQRATQATTEFGIEPTHGLFGSPKWWSYIETGQLSVHRLRGTITRLFMGSMGDWPEFELTGEDGSVSEWTREANSKEQASLYEVGQLAEIDYVRQRHRRNSFDSGAETEVVLEIRVGPVAHA
jgi:hypothetical protein